MKNKTKLQLKKKAMVWKHIIANHIFIDHINERPLNEVVKRIKLYSGVIRKYRAYIDLCTHQIYKDHGWPYKPDTRPGEETYGYKSIEQVYGDLNYISDRFSSEFRLAWMLDLPNYIEGLPTTHDTEE